MKFYNLKIRKTVEVPDSELNIITMKNRKKEVKAEIEGMKLFKIMSSEEAARFSK